MNDLAKDLLIKAAQSDGKKILYLQASNGTTIGSNESTVTLREDRDIAQYKAAIDELEKKGFIQATSAKREIFSITNDGCQWIDNHKE